MPKEAILDRGLAAALRQSDGSVMTTHSEDCTLVSAPSPACYVPAILLYSGRADRWERRSLIRVTFQMRVQVPDDIVCQLPDERQLVAPSQRGQLERPEAHEGRRDPAHHRARLIRCISTAQVPLLCSEYHSAPAVPGLMVASQSLVHFFMHAGPHWLLQKGGRSKPPPQVWDDDESLCRP